MTAILLFFQNYKKIIFGVFLLIIVGVFLVMYLMIGHYKAEITSIKMAQQKSEIYTAKKTADAIVQMNKKLQESAIQTGKITEQIKSLKIEGKCIKDEDYYKTANSIVTRFNDSLH
jgi:predicted Holliday junction resolvase-like endonuclease